MEYVFGPVPSRRLGCSLGISPIPKKTCNYGCIYCQLGRTDHMTNRRQVFFPLEEILREVDIALGQDIDFDVISIVGEGEPTLYAPLGELIAALHRRTVLPVALITNGGLFYDAKVRENAGLADIVLPTLDAYDELSYRYINRPHGHLHFQESYEGLVTFSSAYTGKLYLEMMLMNGVNDDMCSLLQFRELLRPVRYDQLYINTPVRPPAEKGVCAAAPERICAAAEFLGGISIAELADGGFFSDIEDDYEAILGIIGRHPMNQHEITGFLESRGHAESKAVLERLDADDGVVSAVYKGYVTYRLK